jgi:hypothetical protein
MICIDQNLMYNDLGEDGRAFSEPERAPIEFASRSNPSSSLMGELPSFSVAEKAWKDADPRFAPLVQLRIYENDLNERSRCTT